MTSVLSYDRIECVPLVHGRLAFAIEVRRRLLSHRYDCVAVELPPSLQPSVDRALDLLPTMSVVLYRETLSFLDGDNLHYFVPVQPGDVIIEALRIARGERIPCFFVDAEVPDFEGRATILPDPYVLHTLGLEGYFEACRPALEAQVDRRPLAQTRELHMAARLRDLLRRFSGRILFVGGMAHWTPIRRGLQSGVEKLYDDEGVPPEAVEVFVPEARSVPFIVGEIPFVVGEYEKHRSGWELDDFDAVAALKSLLFEARAIHVR